MERMCAKCIYVNKPNSLPPCIVCKDHDRWEEPFPKDWLEDWLSSFDTNSATQCFTAVNLLKKRLEEEE